MWLNLVMITVIFIATCAYLYAKRQFNFWKVRGVPFIKPDIPFGNIRGVGSEFSMAEIWLRHYEELKGKGPIAGVFFFTSPAAMAMDLDLLRHIFVKDFQHFTDRPMYVNERDDPLSAHLFSIGGAKWRSLRAKLSPTFTSGKMKMLHTTMQAVVEQFREHLVELSRGRKVEVDLKELLAQFTTDVIGSAAFGVECNSMKDPDSEFRVCGKRIFDMTFLRSLKIVFLQSFPHLGNTLRMCITQQGVTDFCMKLLGDTVKYREKNNVQRSDFLQLLMQIKNTGKLEDDGVDLGKLTFNELAAQVFIFFAAGFETSSSTMTFALYELALNQEIQKKAREEVEKVLQKHNGQMSYEAAMDLTYIDQIINETLRKYPIVDTLVRKVTIPYKVPNTDLVLEKGSKLLIPVMGIQRDPDYFPEPEKFDPDRFTKENVATRHPYAWMPFGLGPRNCVGARFGMMQTRMGIAMILKNFRVTSSKNTPIPLRFEATAQLLTPAGGMFLNIEPITR